MGRPAPSSCAHCGLRAPAGQRFCCFGCELCYRIRLEGREDHAGLVGRLNFSLVLAMIVMMLALFLYAEDVFDAAGDVEMAWMRAAYRWASLALATPVMVLAGGPLAASAAAQMRRGRLSMDALIAVGAFAAYALSVLALVRGRTGIYFDSATAAVVLATFGRSLEAKARSRASRTLGPLLEVARGTVRWRKDDGSIVELSAAEVEPGMRIEIEPGQVVPVDLRLEQESAELDLAILNGESRPIARSGGAIVPAGAIPVSSRVAGTALRASRDSALERLANLARDLAEKSSPTLAWTDRFAAALTPTVAVVAACTVAFWTRRQSLEVGIVTGLAVVLAACPCSYAIASPLVHWITLQTALRSGVLVRSVDALEELARTRIVAFDKTGTLTRTELSVTGERLAAAVARKEVLSLVRALEESSQHPVGRALAAHAGPGPHTSLERRRIIGRGVEAIDERGCQVSLQAGADGSIVLQRDGDTLAAFDLDEQLRPEASEAIDMLRRARVRVVLLSGDAEPRVSHVGRALSIEAHARLTPQEKVRRVGMLGDRTAMVGDGVNDAPALAIGRASFTLGDAAQLAKGIAHVTLLHADLRLVPFTLTLARRGRSLVQWLIGASTAYNVVFVTLAARGTLKPVWAGLSMLISSILAVGFAAASGGGALGENDGLELSESPT